jgi:hypothetical protein
MSSSFPPLFLLAHAALASIAVPGPRSWQGEDALPAADPAITRAELEHHVRFLAADELGGRAPLTAGMERAAQYLAHALAASGVEPAGENGTFFQATDLRRYEVPVLPRLLFTHEDGQEVEAHYGTDFTVRVRGSARATEKLPLKVFYDYNHLRMPLTGNPAEALYFSAGRAAKKRILAEKGIANLEDWGLEIEVMEGEKGAKPGEAKDFFPARLVSAQEPEPEACELVELRGPLVADFERRRFTHVQLLIEERPFPHADENVVGRIRGVGTPEKPELAREVVMLSAHYDHLGIRPVPRGRQREDSIFNGADDDASGCAALLELAQAFGTGKPPARTLVVLFTTGEESGGTGMKRYLRAPAEPLAATVADLNLEMLGRPDELAGGAGWLWLTGHERSNLGAAWQEQGLAIVADPRPAQSFFSRSDNYALALEGVVAQSLSSFELHKDYHRPSDEADKLDYGHLESAARVAFRAASTLADGSLQPVWLAGMRPEKNALPKPMSAEERAAEFARKRAAREGGKDDGAGDEEEDEENDDDGDGGRPH